MAWRSPYLYCPKCGNVYYATQVTPIIDEGKYYQLCPNALCIAIDELVSLDELMIKPIIELNKKGYRTQFCCSGHDLRGPYNQNGYILFVRGIKLPNAPEGWDVERDELGKRICIRSHIDDVGVSIASLNRWIENLEDYHGQNKEEKYEDN